MLDIAASVAERGFAVELSVAPATTTALIGPNGAGKSTLLDIVAGRLRPDSGHVVAAGRDLTALAAHRRGIGLLAQDPLLFPHLSVRQNVEFGPRSAGRTRASARRAAEDWLARVGASALADRMPGQLSGGQAQRVAIARALAAEPSVVLLDEPLAAVDIDAAPALRHLLRDVLADRTAVVATHDILDALLLADRVAVLDAGRVVESGPTEEVLSRPRSDFAARIAGLNLLRGVWDGAALVGLGVSVHGHPHETLAVGGHAVAVFSPSAVAVYRQAGAGSPRNVLRLVVSAIEPRGDLVRIRAGSLQADVTPRAVADLGLVPGDQVDFVVKATEVAIHAAT